MPTLFIYGTLQDANVQQKVIGRTADCEHAQVKGFRKASIQLSERYPVAIPDENFLIDGTIIEVSQHELSKIDAYEGEAYIRVRVTLTNGQLAWMYRLNSQPAFQNRVDF